MLNAENERVKRLVVKRSECRGERVYKENESDDAGRAEKDRAAITRKNTRWFTAALRRYMLVAWTSWTERPIVAAGVESAVLIGRTSQPSSKNPILGLLSRSRPMEPFANADLRNDINLFLEDGEGEFCSAFHAGTSAC